LFTARRLVAGAAFFFARLVFVAAAVCVDSVDSVTTAAGLAVTFLFPAEGVFLVIAIVVSQILAAVSLTGQDCKRLPTPEIYTVSPANSSLFAAPASIYFRASLAGCTAPVVMAGCRHFA